MDKIDSEGVVKRYDSIENIWPIDDKWHRYNYLKIREFINETICQTLGQNQLILNAGSGGQSYDLPEENMHHFDITDSKIRNKANYTVGSIELMPFKNNDFDIVLCVGEVINYCDALKSISEFSRVLKIDGNLVLEFESSKTLELIFKREFNVSSLIYKTFYQGKSETIWYYSEDYIRDLLNEMGFQVVKIKRFHIISILIYRITKSSNFSSKFAILYSIARKIPYINKCASNVIVLAKRTM